MSQSTISLFGEELMTMGKEQSHTFFYNVFYFQQRTNILLSANAFGFGRFKNLLFSKELMTKRKKKMKTLREKNNLITSNTLFNNVSHPIKDIDLYSVLCNHLKTKKKRLNLVFRCVYNVFRNGKKNANYQCFPFPPHPKVFERHFPLGHQKLSFCSKGLKKDCKLLCKQN